VALTVDLDVDRGLVALLRRQRDRAFGFSMKGPWCTAQHVQLGGGPLGRRAVPLVMEFSWNVVERAARFFAPQFDRQLRKMRWWGELDIIARLVLQDANRVARQGGLMDDETIGRRGKYRRGVGSCTIKY